MSAAEPKRSNSKPLMIGCGIVLVLLLLCAGGLTLLGIGGFKAFKAGVEQIAIEEELLQRAILPAEEAPLEAFAPPSVAGFELTTADDRAAFPALGLEAEGHHAKYERGGDVIEVSIYRMDQAEAGAAFDEILRRIDDDDRFASHSHVRLPRSLKFSVDPPALHGHLWSVGGWLVFVRSTTVEDLRPFVEAYFESLAVAKGEANATDEEPVPVPVSVPPVETAPAAE